MENLELHARRILQRVQPVKMNAPKDLNAPLYEMEAIDACVLSVKRGSSAKKVMPVNAIYMFYQISI